jgi:hypothetical protein
MGLIMRTAILAMSIRVQASAGVWQQLATVWHSDHCRE